MKRYIVAFALDLPKTKSARERRAREVIEEISRLNGFVGIYVAVANIVAVFDTKDHALEAIKFMSGHKYIDCIDERPLVSIEEGVES